MRPFRTYPIKHALVAAVAALMAVATVGATGSPVAAATTPPSTTPGGTLVTTDIGARAGISVGSGVLWESDAQQAADLDAIAASGAKWFAFDLDWNHIQYDGPNNWHWNAATDRLVLAARARGLTLMGMAAYSPPWARGPECPPNELHCLPRNPNDYARFVAAAAARYGTKSTDPRLRGSVTSWSLWNEPNHQEFSIPRPDPARYTAMLKASYPAIKAADPSATVITGGTSPAPNLPDGTEIGPEQWLRDLYANGARGSFDAVGHHPYMFPTNPLEAHPWNAFTQTQYIYNVMVENGDGAKKIWATEAGAPTGTDPEAITEAQQSQWVHDYYQGWNTTFRAFTGPLIWFQLRDSGTNIADRWQNLGLEHKDGTPKPGYAAYQQVMRTGVQLPPDDLTGLAVPMPGRRVVASPTGGYYTMAPDGTVVAYGAARFYGSPALPGGLARGMAVMKDGKGYLVLDGFGGVHKYGSARTGVMGKRVSTYFGFDIARDIAVNPNGNGFTVLDGFGGLHRSGYAPAFNLGYWKGWDIIRSFTYSPSGKGAYLLDAFGGVHVAGDAVRRKTAYWPGRDIARGIVIAPDNGGYAVVDAFGGVHRVGSAPGVKGNLAQWTWQHAGGIALVNHGYVVAS
jgi:hypothetical protein